MKEVRDYLITDLPSYASNPGCFWSSTMNG